MKKAILFLVLTGCTLDIYGQNTQSGQKPAFRKGFFNQTELGLLLGSVNNSYGGANSNRAAVVASSFNGYRFTHRLAVGGTLGLEWYAGKALMPLSVGVRGDLGRGRVSPFYAFDAGWGFWLSREAGFDTEGGIHLNPALGLRIATGNGTALTWSLGYNHQRAASVLRGANDTSTRNDYRYNRLALKLGFSF